MMYSKKLLYYFDRLNHGFDKTAISSPIEVSAGSIDNRDQVSFYMDIDGDIIHKVLFKAYGSVPVIAAAEYVSDYLTGKPIVAMKQLSANDILEALELSSLYIHVGALIIRAISQY